METISSMATAAANAVWRTPEPEAREEPVSGQTGDVSKGEPYDAGNKDLTPETSEPIATSTTTAKAETAPTTAPAPTATTAADVTANTTHKDATPAVGASSVKDSSTMPGDSTKGQNDVRDPEDPLTDPKKTEERKNVDDSTGGTDQGDNPVKIEGPGPKPINEVAKENGGDAGNAGKTGSASASGNDSGVDTGAKGEEEEEEDGPQKKSHGSGTGEQYVKSSGLHADGGDFDATKPGAGREADRLLEEKGIPNPTEAAKSHQRDEESSPSGSGETKEKKGLRQKIKEKLHRE